MVEDDLAVSLVEAKNRWQLAARFGRQHFIKDFFAELLEGKAT